MNVRTLLLLAIAVAAAVFIFRNVRDEARESPRERVRLIVGACLGLAVGALLAFWAPRRVPETPGSPGTIVAVVVLWVVGGGLMFVSLPALIGALSGRPPGQPR